MEQTTNRELLDLLPYPAFLAKEGHITRLNAAARGCALEEGTSVGELLITGASEYPEFREGILNVVLSVAGVPCNASIRKDGGDDLFLLEQPDRQELQNYALAGQALRQAMTDLMSVSHGFQEASAEEGRQDLQALTAKLNHGLYTALRLISNMTDAYRYSSDPAPRLETQNICSLLEELVSGSAVLLEKAGRALEYELLTEPLYCLVNEERLGRAVHNLISNAAKYSPRDTPILVTLRRKKELLYFTVENQQTGEPGRDFFQQYSRLPGIEKEHFGIGLGMTMVCAGAAAHGGTVLVERTPENRVRVTMTLRLRKSSGNQVRSPILRVDYAGEMSHGLLEMADILPDSAYEEHL